MITRKDLLTDPHRIVLVVALVFLTAAMLFGGAADTIPFRNMALSTAAPATLIIILLAGGRDGGRTSPVSREQVIVGMLIAAPTALAVVQLTPLPASIWTRLPGREAIVEGFSLIGAGFPVLPLTLTPAETLAGAFRSFPPIAVFILASRLASGGEAVFELFAAVAAVAVLSAAIAVLQVFDGAASSFYLYEFTTRGYGVGVFANANHQATFLLMALLFWSALAGRRGDAARAFDEFGAVDVALLIAPVMLIFGVFLAGSQAGYWLLGPVLVACYFVARTGSLDGAAIGIGGHLDARTSILAGALALSLAAGTALALSGFAGRGGERPEISGFDGASGRIDIASRTLVAIGDHLPFGAGAGSFRDIYPLYEDIDEVTNIYVNHAHNDYLEFLLEGGLAAAAIMAAGLTAWAHLTLSVWRRKPRRGDRFRRAASLVIAVMIVHSLVEFPLRTTTSACAAAVAAAILAAPARRRAGGPKKGLRGVSL